MKTNKMLSNFEISSFCNQMSMILKAGISPVEGLGILISDVDSDAGKDIIETILNDCKKGERFHIAVQNCQVFPKYAINMISLGEESGSLDTVMDSLGKYYESQANIITSIKNAVVYPFTMILMMLVVIFVLISRVLPIFNQVFVQLGSEMNGFSQSLLSIGSIINNSILGIMIVLSVLIVILIFLFKVPLGRNLLKKISSHSIFTKNFVNHMAIGRFASGMALTLKSGMDTYQSLDIVADLVDHPVISPKIRACRERLLEGDTFSEALAKINVFTNLNLKMIAIGYKTGGLDLVMTQIAKQYDEETDRKIQSIISIIEPTLVISLSVIVGMILLSVILPLMGIMASIG